MEREVKEGKESHHRCWFGIEAEMQSLYPDSSTGGNLSVSVGAGALSVHIFGV